MKFKYLKEAILDLDQDFDISVSDISDIDKNELEKKTINQNILNELKKIIIRKNKNKIDYYLYNINISLSKLFVNVNSDIIFAFIKDGKRIDVQTVQGKREYLEYIKNKVYDILFDKEIYFNIYLNLPANYIFYNGISNQEKKLGLLIVRFIKQFKEIFINSIYSLSEKLNFGYTKTEIENLIFFDSIQLYFSDEGIEYSSYDKKLLLHNIDPIKIIESDDFFKTENVLIKSVGDDYSYESTIYFDLIFYEEHIVFKNINKQLDKWFDYWENMKPEFSSEMSFCFSLYLDNNSTSLYNFKSFLHYIKKNVIPRLNKPISILIEIIGSYDIGLIKKYIKKIDLPTNFFKVKYNILKESYFFDSDDFDDFDDSAPNQQILNSLIEKTIKKNKDKINSVAEYISYCFEQLKYKKDFVSYFIKDREINLYKDQEFIEYIENKICDILLGKKIYLDLHIGPYSKILRTSIFYEGELGNKIESFLKQLKDIFINNIYNLSKDLKFDYTKNDIENSISFDSIQLYFCGNKCFYYNLNLEQFVSSDDINPVKIIYTNNFLKEQNILLKNDIDVCSYKSTLIFDINIYDFCESEKNYIKELNRYFDYWEKSKIDFCSNMKFIFQLNFKDEEMIKDQHTVIDCTKKLYKFKRFLNYLRNSVVPRLSKPIYIELYLTNCYPYRHMFDKNCFDGLPKEYFKITFS